MKINFNNVESAEKYVQSSAKGGRNVLSISLTYTEENGKRITISKGLADELNVSDTVFIGLLPSERKIVFSGKKQENLKPYHMGRAFKIYNAALISGIISCFEIEPYFQEHTSVTFRDVEVYDEDLVAVVHILPIADLLSGEGVE